MCYKGCGIVLGCISWAEATGVAYAAEGLAPTLGCSSPNAGPPAVAEGENGGVQRREEEVEAEKALSGHCNGMRGKDWPPTMRKLRRNQARTSHASVRPRSVAVMENDVNSACACIHHF